MLYYCCNCFVCDALTSADDGMHLPGYFCFCSMSTDALPAARFTRPRGEHLNPARSFCFRLGAARTDVVSARIDEPALNHAKMLRTEKEVDRHVQDIFRKLQDEIEVSRTVMLSDWGVIAAHDIPLLLEYLRAHRLLTAGGCLGLAPSAVMLSYWGETVALTSADDDALLLDYLC